MSLLVWNESTRAELNEALPASVVVLPTGATEQHGDHLATGHDTLMIGEIARKAAERASATCEVVLAPVLPFGSSHHHLPFGGTLSLSTTTYFLVVRDLVESMVSAGARRVLLLNGHGGNHELNQLVVRDIATASGIHSGLVLAAASYWDIAREAILADSRLPRLTLPGHAGQFETATMLATNAAMVREAADRREHDPAAAPSINGVRIEAADRWQRFDGYTDFPHRATAEQGAVMLGIVEREVAAALAAFANRPA